MNNVEKFRTRVLQGALQLGVELSDAQLALLLGYLAMLGKWNKAYNLTAVKDMDDMVGLHLLDSISVQPHIQGQRLIDVGTGGGLPGVVLAILNPQNSYTLLDSNGKKTRFLVQVRAELGLDNLTVVQSRVEAYQAQPEFDGVISRAYASIDGMVRSCEHLLATGGRFWAMKGLDPVDEYAKLPAHIQLKQVIPLQVPEVAAQRHLVVLEKV